MENKKSLDLSLFIFDVDQHAHHVETFLQKAAKAHGEAVRSAAWFKWKFFGNPYGDSILACASHDGELVGCVAYGMQEFVVEGKTLKGVLSFETFVDPNYQGQGIFSKLLNVAETEAKARGVQVMLNFPNANSLPGFLKKKWIQLDTNKYFLKPQLSLKLLFALKDIRSGFIPLASNFEQIKSEAIKSYEQNLKGKVDAKVTAEYLNYRFFDFPHGHYLKAEAGDNLAIARLGRRGKLKELQLLHVNLETYNKGALKKLIRMLKQQAGGVDLLSCPAGAHGIMSGLLNGLGFRTVPNKGNICYKVLDPEVSPAMELLELEAINFHTY
jgi:GNAT superfamily N-acetyltransferase